MLQKLKSIQKIVQKRDFEQLVKDNIYLPNKVNNPNFIVPNPFFVKNLYDILKNTDNNKVITTISELLDLLTQTNQIFGQINTGTTSEYTVLSNAKNNTDIKKVLENLNIVKLLINVNTQHIKKCCKYQKNTWSVHTEEICKHEPEFATKNYKKLNWSFYQDKILKNVKVNQDMVDNYIDWKNIESIIKSKPELLCEYKNKVKTTAIYEHTYKIVQYSEKVAREFVEHLNWDDEAGAIIKSIPKLASEHPHKICWETQVNAIIQFAPQAIVKHPYLFDFEAYSVQLIVSAQSTARKLQKYLKLSLKEQQDIIISYPNTVGKFPQLFCPKHINDIIYCYNPYAMTYASIQENFKISNKHYKIYLEKDMDIATNEDQIYLNGIKFKPDFIYNDLDENTRFEINNHYELEMFKDYTKIGKIHINDISGHYCPSDFEYQVFERKNQAF